MSEVEHTSFVDIKESYVDEKLREFFERETREVNIDNVCLFAAKTVEEYNIMAEVKLQGKQKLEAATELAKSVIEKTVAFVAEDKRREVVKNIYYNMGAIQSTIQFIVDISNNPNIINANKWIRDSAKKVEKAVEGANKGSFLSKVFGCSKKSKAAEETNNPAPETPKTPEESTVDKEVVEVKIEESNEGEESKPVKVDKKAEKQRLKMEKEEAERKRKEAELQAKLEELKMTPEERAAKAEEAKKAKEEAENKRVEEAKKAKEEALQKKLDEKKAAEEARQKKIDEAKEAERKRKEAELQAKLEELKTTPEERAAKKKAAAEEVKKAKEEAERKRAEEKKAKEIERKAAKLQAELDSLKPKEETPSVSEPPVEQ